MKKLRKSRVIEEEDVLEKLWNDPTVRIEPIPQPDDDLDDWAAWDPLESGEGKRWMKIFTRAVT